jgi:hypothetical protein
MMTIMVRFKPRSRAPALGRGASGPQLKTLGLPIEYLNAQDF